MATKTRQRHDWIRYTNWANTRPQVNSTSEAVAIARSIIEAHWGYEIEHLIAIILDNQRRIIGTALAGIGGFTTAFFVPEVLFKAFFRHRGATGLILVHNHPSDSSAPSEQDIIFSSGFAGLCTMLRITLIDQFVLTAEEYRAIPYDRNATLVLEQKDG